MTRAQQLAEALILVAKADHYMVGIVEKVSPEELSEAKQILIAEQNTNFSTSEDYKLYDTALDAVEEMEKGERSS